MSTLELATELLDWWHKAKHQYGDESTARELLLALCNLRQRNIASYGQADSSATPPVDPRWSELRNDIRAVWEKARLQHEDKAVADQLMAIIGFIEDRWQASPEYAELGKKYGY